MLEPLSRGTVCALLLLAAVAPVAGQAEDEEPALKASLSVRIADGASAHVPGQRIPLELVFVREGDYDYYFATETHDRSGRLDTEQYIVTPADGAEDPLADYVEGVPGSAASGLRDVRPLEGSPFTMRVYLNEWVRFTRPGTYELVVTSTRVRRHSGRPTSTLRSNVLSLRIEPAPPGWAEQELARAEAAIASGEPEQVQEGITILRHLGSREAALALVRHYSTAQSRFDVFAGLVASPYRAEIVQAMEERLDAGRALPQDYTRQLAILRTLLDHPPGTLDPQQRANQVSDTETEYRRRWLDELMRRMLPEGLI